MLHIDLVSSVNAHHLFYQSWKKYFMKETSYNTSLLSQESSH